MEMVKIKGKAKTSVSWARLIHRQALLKIFEAGCRPVDPFLCPNCGKALDRQPGEFIAFITNHQEVKKILMHKEPLPFSF